MPKQRHRKPMGRTIILAKAGGAAQLHSTATVMILPLAVSAVKIDLVGAAGVLTGGIPHIGQKDSAGEDTGGT